MLMERRLSSFLKRLLMVAAFAVPLAGCLELDQEASTSPALSGVPDVSAAADVQISGSVGDGPVIGATITVYGNGGEMLGSTVSDSAATFRSTFRVRGNQYPLRLVVSGGTDLVTGVAPDFAMVSVMLSPSGKQVNINPFTTVIVKLAEKMSGGLTSGNVDAARSIVLQEMGFGLDSDLIPDPVATEITVENVANLVKSSEALGEMIRRTRDLILAVGKTASGDSVLASLAADLTDGAIDGLGGMGSNPVVASVANVVSAQVLVEAISNRLRVWGVVATSTIDQSITATRADVSDTQLTGSVTLTEQLLEQARIAIVAAQVLDPGSDMAGLAAAVASLAPGGTADQALTVLRPDSNLVLVNAVNQVATASTGEIKAINRTVALDGMIPVTITPPVNTPPVISGSPAGSVTANTAYSFQPTASDADGDSLRFSISNKPAWASFSTSTGRLSGTPATAGSHGGIVIAVTDGTDTVSLPAFAIQVGPAPVVNTPPVISGSPAGSVTANTAYSFQPTASDADGDGLRFSISNKPAWASFSTSTGRLSGTPATAGSHGGIVIAVTDGTDTVSLPAFTIQVGPAPVQTGSLSVTWVAPTQRADGTPLTMSDIDGYRLYYGTVPGVYPDSVDITDGSASSATITDLLPGSYYVVMSTYDTSGLEGEKSAPLVKTVQ